MFLKGFANDTALKRINLKKEQSGEVELLDM